MGVSCSSTSEAHCPLTDHSLVSQASVGGFPVGPFLHPFRQATWRLLRSAKLVGRKQFACVYCPLAVWTELLRLLPSSKATATKRAAKGGTSLCRSRTVITCEFAIAALCSLESLAKDDASTQQGAAVSK
jgi:hypothetical protein